MPDEAALKIRAAFNKVEAEFEAVTKTEKVEVVGLGGLSNGTERHESAASTTSSAAARAARGLPAPPASLLEDNLFRIFGGSASRP